MCAFEIYHLSRHNSNNQSWRPWLFDASVDFASMRRPSRRGAHSICDSDVLVYTANRARLSSTMRRWTVDRRHWSSNGMATIVSPLALVILQRERIPLFDFETWHSWAGRERKRDHPLDRALSAQLIPLIILPLKDVARARRVPLNER